MIHAGLTDRDRLRIEAMRAMQDLPTPSLECIVAVAKSFSDGLEIDDIETGVMREDVRRKPGVCIEPSRVVLHEDEGGVRAEMRVLFKPFNDPALTFHRDYYRKPSGEWRTPKGIRLSGLPAADFEVLYCDTIDKVQRLSEGESDA